MTGVQFTLIGTICIMSHLKHQCQSRHTVIA